MIGQHQHLVVRCPVCSRPLRVALQHVGVKVACNHCHGLFIVHQVPVDSPTASVWLTSRSGTTTCLSGAQCGRFCWLPIRCNHGVPSRVSNGTAYPRVPASPRPRRLRALAVRWESRQAGIVLAELHNEVFVRVATDITRTGTSVLQASSAEDALRYAVRFEPPLVIANVDLPDSSGWLLAAKLRLCARRVPLWIYTVRPTRYDRLLARFLQVDKLISYQGDLWALSAAILSCLACWRADRRKSEISRDAARRDELSGRW